jgi:hypothetical protein
MVDLGNGMGDITADFLERTFLKGPTSASAFYFENSFGKAQFTGEVFGPYPFQLNGCNVDAMAEQLKPLVPSGRCDQYAFVFPRVQVCKFAGQGRLPTAGSPETLSWYNGFEALSCTTAAQEPGHNYGLRHAWSMSCGLPPFAADPTTCTTDEYGDTFDAMGGGCRHFNVWEKQFMGWLQGCNAIKVTSTGTFNLFPAELGCDGIQSIQVPFPAGKIIRYAPDIEATYLTSYYLEYRTSNGFDQGLQPQVLVHVGAEPSTSEGSPTWLLNTTGVWGHPGLTSGGVLEDPNGGLTIEVKALSAAMATVEITYAAGSGAPTCSDGTALPDHPAGTCHGVATLVDEAPSASQSGCSCAIADRKRGANRAQTWPALLALTVIARRTKASQSRYRGHCRARRHSPPKPRDDDRRDPYCDSPSN